MALQEKEPASPSSMDVLQRSHTVQEFKRQYFMDREQTLLSRMFHSDEPKTKVFVTLVFLLIFTAVVIIGGLIAKWCEYNRYDEVVDVDILFREEIKNALNNSELFDELDSKYTSWIVENPWTVRTSLFYWLTLMTTIGYGNIYPITAAGRLWTMIFGTVSILTSGFVVKILANEHKVAFTRTETFKKYPKTCLCLMFISSSLFFGFLFYLIERDTGIRPGGQEGWTFSQSFYFVIVTMTTVGFGDFIPTTVITVILIIYAIIMLSMLMGEVTKEARKIEKDIRQVIELAEQGYMKAANATSQAEMKVSPPETCGTNVVELQNVEKPSTTSVVE